MFLEVIGHALQETSICDFEIFRAYLSEFSIFFTEKFFMANLSSHRRPQSFECKCSAFPKNEARNHDFSNL